MSDNADDLLAFVAGSEKIKQIFGTLNLDDAVKAFRSLGVDGEDLIKILDECGVNTEGISGALQKAGKSGIGAIGKLKTGFAGLAAKIGVSTTALGVFTGVLAAVGIAFAGFKLYQDYMQGLVDSAKEAGSSWQMSSESLDGQISRLKEIDEIIKQGNLSAEESYNLKSELYSIQRSIVDSYGDEAAGVDLVNGKLSEQVSILENINAASAERFLNENVTGISKAQKEMEKTRTLMLGSYSRSFPDGAKALESLVEKYSDYISISKDTYGLTNTIVFKGDVTQAQEVVNDFMNDLRNIDKQYPDSNIIDNVIKQSSNSLGKVRDIVNEYQNIYEQSKKAEIVSDTNKYFAAGDEKGKTAAAWLSELEVSVNNYNEALASGDTSKIDEAESKFNSVKSAIDSARNEAGNLGLDQYNDQILDIVANLNTAEISAVNFKKALSGDESVLNKNIEQYAKQIKSMGLDDIDLKAMLNNSNNAEFGEYQFRAILDAAEEAGYIVGRSEEEVQRVIDLLIELGYVVGDTAYKTQDANKEISASYKDAVDTVSSLKSELSTINGAISEQGYSGNLSVDTYNSLIAISDDYAACIEYQNGALQLNAEKANMLFEAKSELKKAEIELQKLTEATKWKENADEIARLTKEYDGLDSAISDKIKSLEKENDGIEANLIGYDLQIAAIEELTSAYGRWKSVSESDNSDSMYKEIQNAYKAIKEAQKTGQTGVGNVVYQAAVELLVPDGEDAKKYVKTLQRYITDSSNGLSNFINDMVSNGLMERSKDNWNKVSMVAGTTMQEILEKMKITPDMAKAIFNALEMYDFDFHWTDEDFNINTASVEEMQTELKRLQAEADATKAKIAELNEAGTTIDTSTNMSLSDYQKQLDAQVAAYDKVAEKLGAESYDKSSNEIEYTVEVNTEKAETALDAIKDKLEEILKKIEDIFKKELGDLGGGDTLSILKNVLNTLRNINAYKIADKTFTVTQYTTTTGTKPYGSISSHDQNIKNDTSAHAAVASGTRHADAGVALVGDEYSHDGSPKPELIITDGAAYIAGQNGPEFVNLKDGDQVVPASETEEILSRNPEARKSLIPAFATGAGGYPAGSVQEDKYLEGVIGPTQEWLDQQKAAQKAKDDALIKELSAKAAEKSADDTYLNTNAAKNTNSSTKTYLNTSVSGGGDPSSLKNPGSSGSSGGSGSSSSSDSSKKEKSEFEKEYESRQHLLAMEKISYEEYIDWLEDAYKEAYEKGQIELEDFYKY